jgi:hypothetical protein
MSKIHLWFMRHTTMHCRAIAASWKEFDQQINLNNHKWRTGWNQYKFITEDTHMIWVPFFYTSLGMIILTTYPKFTSRALIHFKLFQIYSNWSIQDLLKTTMKFENFLSRKVRFHHKDSRTVEFAFFDFSTIYYAIYKIQDFESTV